MNITHIAFRGTLALALSCAVFATNGATLVTERTLQENVLLDTITVRDGQINAIIENRSDHVVDSLTILVDYAWLWHDEFNPGDDNPGWVEYVTVDRNLMPGEHAPFVYAPTSTLPVRDDGHFMPTATIVGASLFARP